MTFFRHSPCEHGETSRHPTPLVLKDRLGPGVDDVGYDWGNMCPGGTIAPLTVDDLNLEAAAQWMQAGWAADIDPGDYPPDQWDEISLDAQQWWIDTARGALAAALGQTTIDYQGADHE